MRTLASHTTLPQRADTWVRTLLQHGLEAVF